MSWLLFVYLSIVFFLFFFSPVCFCPHRRIDVSPSAFKKHARVFEEMEESDYKVTKRFQNLKFQPSLCASWKSNVLSPPSPTPPSPFKGGAIILNTQDPRVPLVYTLRPPPPPSLPPSSFSDMIIGWVRSCPNKKANQNGSDYWDGVVQAFQWTSKQKP